MKYKEQPPTPRGRHGHFWGSGTLDLGYGACGGAGVMPLAVTTWGNGKTVLEEEMNKKIKKIKKSGI